MFLCELFFTIICAEISHHADVIVLLRDQDNEICENKSCLQKDTHVGDLFSFTHHTFYI